MPKPTHADLYDVTVRGNYVLFWGGWPSQWYPAGEKKPLPASFVISGVRYLHAEQFMMASKARCFGDTKTLVKIMATRHPKSQKELGRSVTPFDAKEWDAVSREVVYIGNLAKFSQNAGLKKLLLATGNKVIVETSPEDEIWGIGMYASDPNATVPRKWRGKNYLGKALMRVRTTLKRNTPAQIKRMLKND